MRLFYENDSDKVSLYTYNVEHDHKICDDVEWGIPKATKEELEQLYISGVTRQKLLTKSFF